MHCCQTLRNVRRAIAVSIALSLSPAVAQTVDLAGAEALARKSACFKCHAVEREKDGPSFKEVAARNRSAADAEAGLVRFLKTGAKPGKESAKERHPQAKSSDDAEIANLVRYVLSR